MSNNEEMQLTLDDAVEEVLGALTGLELSYVPELDRYRAITRCLNRALRANALEREWSWYHDMEDCGPVYEGQLEVTLRPSVRVRQTGDDAVRLVDGDGLPQVWAYFLPRDALHKYSDRTGLWAAVTRQTITFSHRLHLGYSGLSVHVPVMREPTMFRLPEQPEDPEQPAVVVPADVREQLIDFAYPDIITLRAAFYYAQTDPVMQPRTMTLEAQYKDLMYQVIERDDRMTDSPFQNEFTVPVQNGIVGTGWSHRHPHADERR